MRQSDFRKTQRMSFQEIDLAHATKICNKDRVTTHFYEDLAIPRLGNVLERLQRKHPERSVQVQIDG